MIGMDEKKGRGRGMGGREGGIRTVGKLDGC